MGRVLGRKNDECECGQSQNKVQDRGPLTKLKNKSRRGDPRGRPPPFGSPVPFVVQKNFVPSCAFCGSKKPAKPENLVFVFQKTAELKNKATPEIQIFLEVCPQKRKHDVHTYAHRGAVGF
jgi:hypothetical protein